MSSSKKMVMRLFSGGIDHRARFPTLIFLITDGGLPRIDAIGYNLRVDWNVLMVRIVGISPSNH